MLSFTTYRLDTSGVHHSEHTYPLVLLDGSSTQDNFTLSGDISQGLRADFCIQTDPQIRFMKDPTLFSRTTFFLQIFEQCTHTRRQQHGEHNKQQSVTAASTHTRAQRAAY